MRQEEINRDLKHYITEKKDKPFWKKSATPKIKPKTDEEVNLMLHGDTHYKDSSESSETHYQTQSKIANISSQDKKDLEEIEHKIEEVNEVEQKVEEEFEEERQGLLSKFFKKLNFSKSDKDDFEPEAKYNPESKMDDEELRELLHGLHNWIIQLPTDKLEKFKTSKEFELYTNYLRKHNLIK
jgi:hypothetical protein